MPSNDDVVTFSSFDDCNVNDTTHCAASFTIYINSIVNLLVFGDIGSPFLNAVFETAIILSAH